MKKSEGGDILNIEVSRVVKLSKQGKFGPSYVTLEDSEILTLVNEFKGSGIINLNKKGEWNNCESIVKNSKIIGVIVNNLTGKEVETSNFKIHYSKKGVHIVPDYPNKKER